MGRTFTVAAVQAAYVLMDRDATTERVIELTGKAAAQGASLIVFPEVFVPGTPIWIDSVPIWDGDEAWFARLVDQAVVVPSATTERIGAAAREAGAHVIVGIDEREPNGTTIFNTILYFGPDGRLLNKHRKLMPTGSERTVWGMGDGSTLEVVSTDLGRIGGLICWGELHAAGPVPPVRTRRRRLGGTHTGPGRRLDRHHAPHRPRGTDVGDRREPVRTSRPDPRRLPGPGPGLADRRGGAGVGGARQHRDL
jgi:hypothetical protein